LAFSLIGTDSRKNSHPHVHRDYWDWDDLNVAMDNVSAMMSEVRHQVDVITVMRPTTPLPDGNAML